MTTPRPDVRVHCMRRRAAGLRALLLLVPALLIADFARADDDTTLDPAALAALSEQQRIDRETGALDSPLLIRLRARVSPSWPGPRGEPPVTERRHCPVIPDDKGNEDKDPAPPFC